MINVEKLIEQYQQAAEKWEKRHPVTYTFDLRVQDALREAATALSTLQAEHEKLRAELEYEKENANAYYEECGQWEAENEKLRAKLEQAKAERDAAVNDLEDLMADTEDSVCWLCAKADSTEPCRGEKGTCTPKWRGIQTDSSPYLVADEATEFTKEQWAWLLNRFTKKED